MHAFLSLSLPFFPLRRASMEDTQKLGPDGEPPVGKLLLLRKTSSFHPESTNDEEVKAEKAARVPWVVEVAVVSQRMFKDMLRKPSLVVTHLAACAYFGGKSWHTFVSCLFLFFLFIVYPSD